MSEVNTIYSLTEPVVLAHPNLFEAKAFKGPNGKDNGEPKFSGNFLFKPESTDLAAMKAVAAQVARAKWPDRSFKDLQFPFLAGDKLADKRKEKKGKSDGDFQRGHVVIAARSKFQPRLSCIINGKMVDLEGDLLAKHKGLFFFGAEVLAQFNFQAYDGVGNNPDGVTAYLNMVFSTGKGTKIAGGGATAAETFKGYVGNPTTVDPTAGQAAGLDDEIPM